MGNSWRSYFGTVVVVSTLFLMAGCALLRKKAPIQELNGTWVPVQQEMGGSTIAKAFIEPMELVIADSRYTVVAGSEDRGTIRYTADKMDIYGKKGANAGKHFMAIYKLDNGDLTICYNLKGDGYPKDFETKGNAMYFLCTYRKVEQH